MDGGSWYNTMGYYSYTQNNPPTSISQIHPQVLLPNTATLGAGGGLVIGDMVQVGTGSFPAGTVIGFYLVSSGWQNGIMVPGFYTNYTLPSLNINNNQQCVLYFEKDCNAIVMSWEDMSQSDPTYTSDDDFNDVIYTVSDNEDPLDNPSTSFDLSKVPQL
jgi:hypothetical protein